MKRYSQAVVLLVVPQAILLYYYKGLKETSKGRFVCVGIYVYTYTYVFLFYKLWSSGLIVVPNSLILYLDFYMLGLFSEIQFSSVQSLSRVRLFATPMNRSTPGLPVHHQLPELTQSQVHRVSDAIQPSHPLSSPLITL